MSRVVAQTVIAIVALCGAAFSLPANAHKVIGAVFVTGDLLEGEFGYSNGDMASAGTPVQLLAPDDAVVAETVTDAQGAFVFRVDKALAYRVVADLGQGHVATVEVPPEDIALDHADNATVQPEPDKTTLPGVDTDALVTEIERRVAAQLKPMQRDIQALQSAIRLSDILGGIGVIIGLCGVAALWLARRGRVG